MTKEQFNKETNYYIAIAIAKAMLIHQLIDDADYKEIEKMFIEKYNPIVGMLKL